MYLFLKYSVLIILSYQCITTYSIFHEKVEDVISYDESKPVGNHCVILFPVVDKHFMPIPYQPNITGAAIITPDKDGYLFITNEERFQFSCSGNTFVSPTVCKGQTEVTVKCLRDNKVSHKGREYFFDRFRCSRTPKAKLTVANTSCNGVENGVFNIGFDTRVPLSLYKVCYDAKIKNTLYSWTYVNAPIYKFIQTSKAVPQFVKTKIFEDIDILKLYDQQSKSAALTLGGTTITEDRIINKQIGHFLLPGRLLTRNQFPYVFQQLATYFYENTAPQWSLFSRGVWREVERLFLRNLNKVSGKHLIAAGTVNATYLVQSKTIVQKPFVLLPPDSVPVPLFVWRLIYNVEKQKGIVFMGLNNPFRRETPIQRYCEEIPCPSKFSRKIHRAELIYCCSKESFEKSYGPLDPVVYQAF